MNLCFPSRVIVWRKHQEVIEKILYLNEIGVIRYAGQIDIGGQPFKDVIKGIELFASKVAPVIRKYSKGKDTLS